MGLTLEQLVELKTAEDIKERLLYALQGIGFESKSVSSTGSGGLQAFGVAAVEASIQVKISTAGELGSGAFRVSTDGGVTFGSPVTIPSNGSYVIPDTGCTIFFSAGPTGSGTSFEVNDLFSFELTLPTFPVTAWQPFSTPLTLVELDAEAMENFSATQQAIAKGGFLELSTGPWLDLVLQNQYDLERGGGIQTVGTVYLTDSANQGPFTIGAGNVWVGTTGGLRFNNTTGGTLPLGGSLALTVKAETKGSAYNVGANTITVLFTALAGVTVNNPNPVGGSWISTHGTDRESDGLAVVRAKARWPSLGIANTEDKYVLWAKTASPSVTRAISRPHPTSPGTVQVFLAGNGTVDASVVTAVQDYLDQRPDLCVIPVADSAEENVQTVTATLYVAAGNAVAAAAAVEQNLTALFYSGTNSIGEALPGIAIGGTVYTSAIIEQLMLSPGARNVALTSPGSDTALGPTEVAVLDSNVTIVEV